MSQTSIPIQSMRVAEPLDQAFRCTVRMLLRPFNIAVWFSLGATIFLETQFASVREPALAKLMPEFTLEGSSLIELAEDAVRRIGDYSAAATGMAVFSLVCYMAYIVIASWIQSRGQLMLVRAIALDDERIDVNWNQTRRQHRSLFIANLSLRFLAMLLTVVIGFIAYSMLSDQANSDEPSILMISLIMFVSMSSWLIGLVTLHSTSALLRSFIVPLMFHFNISCLEACREFMPLFRYNVISLTLFFLLYAAFRLLIAFIGGIVGVLTLFIGFLPIIHHTLLAPLYIMERALSMYMLQSLGADYLMVRPRQTW